MNRWLLFLNINIFLISSVAAGTPVVLNDLSQSNNLRKYAELHIEPLDRPVSEIGRITGWSPALSGSPDLGLEPHQHWLKFSLKNPSQKSIQLFLELDSVMIDDPELYTQQSGGTWGLAKKGSAPSLAWSTSTPLTPIFEFYIAANTTREYLLKFRDEGNFPLPLQLWSAQEFTQHNLYRLSYTGVFFGILSVVALYNLFLWIVSREPVFFSFLMFVTSFLLLIFTWYGNGRVFWYPEASVLFLRRTVLVLLAATWFWFARFSQIYCNRPINPIYFKSLGFAKVNLMG